MAICQFCICSEICSIAVMEMLSNIRSVPNVNVCRESVLDIQFWFCIYVHSHEIFRFGLYSQHTVTHSLLHKVRKFSFYFKGFLGTVDNPTAHSLIYWVLWVQKEKNSLCRWILPSNFSSFERCQYVCFLRYWLCRGYAGLFWKAFV